MMLLTLACGILAFALFGLASDRHQHRRRPGLRRSTARVGAWGATILCLPLAVLARGWVFGPVLWLGALMFGAAAAFLVLNLWPDRTRRPGRRA